MGFGQIMLRLGKSIDTILNQLIDAGTLANVSGGIMNRSMKIAGNNKSEIEIDRWHWGDLDSAETPFAEFPRPNPSTVLFSLLGYLVDMTKEVASTTDAMTGDVSQNMQPTTLLALIEQGQKVYAAIYKRLFRGCKAEYRAIMRVNAQNISPDVILSFHDGEVGAEDFMLDSMDISPTADPSMASDMTKMARAGVYQQFMGDPMVDQFGIRKEIFEAGNLNIELLVPPPEEAQPDPAALLEMEKLQMESDKIAVTERKADNETRKIDLEAERLEVEKVRAKYENLLKHAQAVGALASAEAAEEGTQLAIYKADLDQLNHEEKTAMEMNRDDHQRRMDGVQEQRAIREADERIESARAQREERSGATGGQANPTGNAAPSAQNSEL